MRALVTGFEPYGSRGINPSGEVAKALDRRTIGGVAVTGRLLPVSFRWLREGIEALLDEVRPDVVISLGLWPGEPMIRLERLGANIADFEIADNEGLLAENQAIAPNGPPALLATLPLREIQRALLAAGIPARLSGTAGTFLCNTTLYSFLAAVEARGAAVRCGFVHVPYVPEQVADLLAATERERRLEQHQRADLASMELATMVRAIEMAIEVCARTGQQG